MRTLLRNSFDLERDTTEEVYDTYEAVFVGACVGLIVSRLLGDTTSSSIDISLIGPIFLSEVFFTLKQRVSIGMTRR